MISRANEMTGAKEPLRVLQVIGAMDRAGAETMIMNLYRAIDRQRVQFDFLVHEMRECDYDGEIEELGGRIYRLPRFNGVNALTYAGGARSLIASHPEWRVVHGHIGSSAALYLTAAKKEGRAAVAHSHAQHFPLSVGQLGFRAVSYPTRFVADEFLACSRQAGIDRFGTKVVEGDRFHVLKNGIDVERYECSLAQRCAAKRAFGWGEGPVIGHVGRLTPVKNHEFLLKVFSNIRQRRPGAKLVLVGRGECEPELRALASRLGMEGSVVFYGMTDDVASVLKAFDAFVFPSYKEGLGMAAVEAQAAGVPVVLSEGVSPEAVISSRAVRLPLSAGTEVWADTALAFMEDEPDRLASAEQVRQSGFDVADSAAWLSDFYERLAAFSR